MFSVAPINFFYYAFIRSLSLRCVPFRDIFSISIALSLGVVLRLRTSTPGGSEASVVGRNIRWNQDNKKSLAQEVRQKSDISEHRSKG